MKFYKKYEFPIHFILAFALIGLLMYACDMPERQPNKTFTVKVGYIDGYQDTLTYIAPADTEFYVIQNGENFTMYGRAVRYQEIEVDGIVRVKVISVK